MLFPLSGSCHGWPSSRWVSPSPSPVATPPLSTAVRSPAPGRFEAMSVWGFIFSLHPLCLYVYLLVWVCSSWLRCGGGRTAGGNCLFPLSGSGDRTQVVRLSCRHLDLAGPVLFVRTVLFVDHLEVPAISPPLPPPKRDCRHRSTRDTWLGPVPSTCLAFLQEHPGPLLISLLLSLLDLCSQRAGDGASTGLLFTLGWDTHPPDATQMS